MAVSRGYEADEEKDWVLDSLDRYERLHVFELQEPTLCMEWSHDGTALFLAGFSQVKHNELLQLILPEKLIAADKQTLLAGRDFKISRGALAKGPIHHIRCADQIRNVIITSGLGPELTVWEPDPGSPDLLVSTGNVATPTPTSTDPDTTELLISWTFGHPQSLVSGSSLNTLQVTDLNTLQPLWSYTPKDKRGSDVAIHAVESLSGENHIFLTCSDRGELILWDSRVPGTGSLKFSPSPTTGASSGGTEGGHAMAVCGNKCATLSDRGRLRIFDRRGASWIPQASCITDTYSGTPLI
ncbi:WD repeat-containing protein 73 [Geodia barretti]|uniref:WD repeat-containing protein 73 n=1 Tax=Geodia barretti TaxID=519541 RepID=A0AA35RH71_GEOBA|nr:WD repeat-containing protein 73 [Geodia barretti]